MILVSCPPKKTKQLIANPSCTILRFQSRSISNMELIESSFIKKGFLSGALSDYSVTGKKYVIHMYDVIMKCFNKIPIFNKAKIKFLSKL